MCRRKAADSSKVEVLELHDISSEGAVLLAGYAVYDLVNVSCSSSTRENIVMGRIVVYRIEGPVRPRRSVRH